ncbi:hypothetical protein KIPB_016169, partial [Kipferlia bialata]
TDPTLAAAASAVSRQALTENIEAAIGTDVSVLVSSPTYVLMSSDITQLQIDMSALANTYQTVIVYGYMEVGVSGLAVDKDSAVLWTEAVNPQQNGAQSAVVKWP